MSEQEFLTYLGSNGWNVKWISILEQDASQGSVSQEEAAQWASSYGLDTETVLFDPTNEWMAQALAESGGFPTVYSVHTSNMLIWDYTAGWIDPASADWTGFKEWWPSFLNYCATQPGAVN